MAYSVVPHPKKPGRFRVISAKGKVWKTDYASVPAAEKAIAYIEGRFGASSPKAPPSEATPTGDAGTAEADTSAERRALGIPQVEDEEGGW